MLSESHLQPWTLLALVAMMLEHVHVISILLSQTPRLRIFATVHPLRNGNVALGTAATISIASKTALPASKHFMQIRWHAMLVSHALKAITLVAGAPV